MIKKLYFSILVKVKNFSKVVDCNREKGSFSRFMTLGFRSSPEFVAGFMTFLICALIIVVLIICIGLLINK